MNEAFSSGLFTHPGGVLAACDTRSFTLAATLVLRSPQISTATVRPDDSSTDGLASMEAVASDSELPLSCEFDQPKPAFIASDLSNRVTGFQ
jgi:hypothetical protein